jgi:hypothetical protein
MTRSIPAARNSVAAQIRRNNEGSSIPGTRKPLAAVWRPNSSLVLATAAANAAPAAKPEIAEPKKYIEKVTELATNKTSTEGHVVTLITAVQEITTALKTTETEDERFKRHYLGDLWACHKSSFAIRAAHVAHMKVTDFFSPLGE